MKKLLKVMVVALVISILSSSVALANIGVSSSIITSATGELEGNSIYYAIANKVYQNYMKGIKHTEIGLKGIDADDMQTNGSMVIWYLLKYICEINPSMAVSKIGDITKIVIDATEINELKNSNELETVLNSLLIGASSYSSIREKLGYINDEIVRTCEYEFGEGDSTAQGALVNKFAVCGGYNNVVYEVCKRLGVKEVTHYLTASNHVSNMVYVDNQWYLWDLTWCVGNHGIYGTEVATNETYTSSAGYQERVMGRAERSYFLIPLNSRTFEIYKSTNNPSAKDIGFMEAMQEIKYPDTTSLDFSSFEGKEVDISTVKEPNEIIKEEPPVIQPKPVEKPKLLNYMETQVISIDSKGNIIKDTTKPKTAKVAPATTKVSINGKTVSIETYTIKGSAYFNLRDIAMAIKGTKKKFNISTLANTKNTPNILTGIAYVPVGKELSISKTKTVQQAKLTTPNIYINGVKANFTMYTIAGNSYFKLSELSRAIGFTQAWDAKAKITKITA